MSRSWRIRQAHRLYVWAREMENIQEQLEGAGLNVGGTTGLPRKVRVALRVYKEAKSRLPPELFREIKAVVSRMLEDDEMYQVPYWFWYWLCPDRPYAHVGEQYWGQTMFP